MRSRLCTAIRTGLKQRAGRRRGLSDGAIQAIAVTPQHIRVAVGRTLAGPVVSLVLATVAGVVALRAIMASTPTHLPVATTPPATRTAVPELHASSSPTRPVVTGTPPDWSGTSDAAPRLYLVATQEQADSLREQLTLSDQLHRSLGETPGRWDVLVVPAGDKPDELRRLLAAIDDAIAGVPALRVIDTRSP